MSDDVLDALAAPLVQRAQTREARYVALHDEKTRQNPYGNPAAILADVTATVKADDAALRADLFAAERTADEVVRSLEDDAHRAALLPSAVGAVRGTPSETATAVHTARLVDLFEAQAVRDLLTRPVAQVADVYAQLDDMTDGTFLHALEHALLNGWTPTNPDDAVKAHDLKNRVAARQAGRVPPDLVDTLDRARRTRDRVNMWRLTLANVPQVDEAALADMLRRHRG